MDQPAIIINQASASDWQKQMAAAGYKIVLAPLYRTEMGGASSKPKAK
jgi:hypothetical protein